MKTAVSAEPLEPTYSTQETRAYLGCGKTQVFELIKLGERYKGCHPTRGGLYPTFKASHKNRRVPLSAIEQHTRHVSKIQLGGVR